MANSPFPPAALDLSVNPQSATIWSIEQAQAGTPGIASNSATLAVDLRGVQVALGNPATMLPTAQEFERSLSTIQKAKPKIEFYPEEVTGANAEWMDKQAKRVLSGPVQVTTALTITTLAGSGIVSLTTTRTTPTSTSTTFSITAHEELLQALRAMEHRNPQLPREISKHSRRR